MRLGSGIGDARGRDNDVNPRVQRFLVHGRVGNQIGPICGQRQNPLFIRHMQPAIGEVMRDLYLGRSPVVDVSPLTADRFACSGLRPELNIV